MKYLRGAEWFLIHFGYHLFLSLTIYLSRGFMVDQRQQSSLTRPPPLSFQFFPPLCSGLSLLAWCLGLCKRWKWMQETSRGNVWWGCKALEERTRAPALAAWLRQCLFLKHGSQIFPCHLSEQQNTRRERDKDKVQRRKKRMVSKWKIRWNDAFKIPKRNNNILIYYSSGLWQPNPKMFQILVPVTSQPMKGGRAISSPQVDF